MSNRVNIVKMIANLSPWLAPIPSCYFVTRSSIQYLGTPLVIGIIIGIIVETLGVSTVNVYLMLLQWNMKKRATDPKAPENLALTLIIFYLLITITLTVILEIFPNISIITPAIFPLLSLVGAFTLVLVYQQEQREFEVQQSKLERSMKRHYLQNKEQVNVFSLGKKDSNLDVANEARKQKKVNILEQLSRLCIEHPEMGVTELKNKLGVRSRSTVYSYLKQLNAFEEIKRT